MRHSNFLAAFNDELGVAQVEAAEVNLFVVFRVFISELVIEVFVQIDVLY